jgi:hypothetical protein
MKNKSRTYTTWAIKGILDALVAEGKMATYGFLAEHVGYHPHSATLWTMLGDIVAEDVRNKQPLRSVLIVNADTSKPGKLFYGRAEDELKQVITDEDAFRNDQLRALGVSVTAEVLKPQY